MMTLSQFLNALDSIRKQSIRKVELLNSSRYGQIALKRGTAFIDPGKEVRKLVREFADSIGVPMPNVDYSPADLGAFEDLVVNLKGWANGNAPSEDVKPAKRSRKRSKGPNIPNQLKKPYELWPNFKADRKAAGKRPLMRLFAEWLRTKHGITIDRKRFAEWKKQYEQNQSRQRNKSRRNAAC